MIYSRISVSLFFFLHGLCFASWGGRIPDIAMKHNLSEGTLGTLLLMLPVGSILSMPLASFLVSRFGSRRVLTTAVPLYASALVLVGLSPDIPLLVASLILFGLISNHVNVSLNTQAIKLEGQYQKPIMASLHGLWSLAGFAGAGIGSLMMKYQFVPYEHFTFVAITSYIITAFMCRHLIVDQRRESTGYKFTFRLPEKTSLFWVSLLLPQCFVRELCLTGAEFTLRMF